MAFSRLLVRLRKDVATIVFRPMKKRDVERFYHLNTAKALRCLLTAEYRYGRGGHQYGRGCVAPSALGRLVGPAPRGGFAFGASTPAVSSAATLWGGF